MRQMWRLVLTTANVLSPVWFFFFGTIEYHFEKWYFLLNRIKNELFGSALRFSIFFVSFLFCFLRFVGEKRESKTLENVEKCYSHSHTTGEVI